MSEETNERTERRLLAIINWGGGKRKNYKVQILKIKMTEAALERQKESRLKEAIKSIGRKITISNLRIGNSTWIADWVPFGGGSINYLRRIFFGHPDYRPSASEAIFHIPYTIALGLYQAGTFILLAEFLKNS